MWNDKLIFPCSPCYIFDIDTFFNRCKYVKAALADIPLTYSIKANPFLLKCIPKEISHVEVCSPGELSICMSLKVAPESIIYSGVTKESHDIERAVSYDVGLLTAESLLHVILENQAVIKLGKPKKKVLLRLTSGNQFGMSEDDIRAIIANKGQYQGLEFYGIHYYSGTQKKIHQIKKDLQKLDSLLQELKEKYGFEAHLVEYGPGLSTDYFEPPYEETDMQTLKKALPDLTSFSAKYPLGIEMGRFLAASCGNYLTQIKDSKVNNDTNYSICDGGIHHLKYHGHKMAMQVPPVGLYTECENIMQNAPVSAHADKTVPYMICGSLCTTADVLIREVNLCPAEIGNYLLFGRCGAYSVTEGSSLFLSRTMPQVYLYRNSKGYRLVRDFIETSLLNGSGNLL